MELYSVFSIVPVRLVVFSGNLCRISLKLTYRMFRSFLRKLSHSVLYVWDTLNTSYEPILVIGARNSGKSGLIYRIKLGDFIPTTPTGSCIEEQCDLCKYCLVACDGCGHEALLECDKYKITLCEIGFNDNVDVLHDYMRVCSRIIFVVDPFSLEHSGETLAEISTIIAEHNFYIQFPKYVIFVTKGDLACNIKVADLAHSLQIPQHLQPRCKIVKGSSLCGDGVYEALEFLLVESKHNRDLIDLG